MIFCAKNEDGVPTWKLILEGKKTVTRRLKPMPVGKEFAIQPGRGKKAVAKGKVLKCERHLNWLRWWSIHGIIPTSDCGLEIEAFKEGFKTWQNLKNWFKEHEININDTYRIEFEMIEVYNPQREEG